MLNNAAKSQIEQNTFSKILKTFHDIETRYYVHNSVPMCVESIMILTFNGEKLKLNKLLILTFEI